MNGQYFEKYCANLLISYGFVDVHITPGSGDQGVDIIGKYNNLKYAVQCKRYSSKLGNTPVQEVTAGKNYYQCECALVITNNFFINLEYFSFVINPFLSQIPQRARILF